MIEVRDEQSTARQTIQNCQTSPVDFQHYSLHHKAHLIGNNLQLVLTCHAVLLTIFELDFSSSQII
jgi:hypothetical protein